MITRRSNLVASRREEAMTLLEMLVSVSIMIVIVFGLTATFNQTQRVFRAGMSQTDTLEGGRAALDLIRRDLEPSVALRHVPLNAPLISVGLENTSLVAEHLVANSGGTTVNVTERFFLMRQSIASQFSQEPANTNFIGIGYRILNLNTNVAAINTPPALVGTLYRFSNQGLMPPTQYGFPAGQGIPPQALRNFAFANGSQGYRPSDLVRLGYLNPVIEGVVHFRVNFYDSYGQQIYYLNTLYPVSDPNYLGAWQSSNDPVGFAFYQPVWYQPHAAPNTPAYVEIELGVLDPPILEQYKAKLAAPSFNLNRAISFLDDHLGNIHYYRSQVPLRANLTQ